MVASTVRSTGFVHAGSSSRTHRSMEPTSNSTIGRSGRRSCRAVQARTRSAITGSAAISAQREARARMRSRSEEVTVPVVGLLPELLEDVAEQRRVGLGNLCGQERHLPGTPDVDAAHGQ